MQKNKKIKVLKLQLGIVLVFLVMNLLLLFSIDREYFYKNFMRKKIIKIKNNLYKKL